MSRLLSRLRCLGIGLAFASCFAAAAACAHEGVAPPATHVLGRLDFPTSSKSGPAQAAFTEGMLYLHIFEYTSAAQSFRRAQELDPGFAMAYWGEAMSYTHPVWNQQDLDAGRAALMKLAPTPAARAAKAGSARERDFLAAVEILYGEGDKPARDLALLAAMEAMAKRYPKDDEVQLFLALALLGADEGRRDLPRFLRAAEIAKAVYRHNPQHPGAAHYWIHGMDDPQHAAGALEAANALAKIAPDAGHSQHMTSHIFIALGRWPDVVEANVAALRVVNAELAARAQPEFRCGHYSEWLEYAYLQQGREDEASALLDQCAATGAAAVAWMRAHAGTSYLNAKAPGDLEQNYRTSLARMRSLALVDAPGQRTQLLAQGAEDLEGADGYAAGLLFARGLAALDAGDTGSAQSVLADLQARATAAGVDVYPRIMARMLEGALAARGGDLDSALTALRAAAQDYEAQPFDFGPPATVKPPRELLGEILLAAGRADEARVAFQAALATAPERRAALAGLAASGGAPATH